MSRPRSPERTGPRVTQYRLKQVGKKQCRRCRKVKLLAAFNLRDKERGYYKHWCRDCEKEHWKGYYRAHGDHLRERSKHWYRAHYQRLQEDIFAAYGARCSCCGESEKLFLTIDHIHNDGHLQKTRGGKRYGGWTAWREIKREGFPKDRYRILCYNCNCGRQQTPDKRCPHEAGRVVR